MKREEPSLAHAPKAVNYKLREALAEAFNQTIIFAQQKKLFPDLREYCEKVLKLKFRGSHARCPLHRERKGMAFYIDDCTQKWRCWGKCEDWGDVLDLHRALFAFATKQEAIDSLLSLGLKQGHPCLDSLPQRRAAAAVALNEKRLRRIWRQYARVGREYVRERSPVHQPTAADFAQLLLELMDRGELPIVFVQDVYTPLIGQRARRALEKWPERIQYLCCCTARQVDGRTGPRTSPADSSSTWNSINIRYLSSCRSSGISRRRGAGLSSPSPTRAASPITDSFGEKEKSRLSGPIWS